MHPKIILESISYRDGKYSFVTDNAFYYIKSQSTGNCYFIAPVARRPSCNDTLSIQEENCHYILEHIIPDAEKINRRLIGELIIEESNIVTFAQSFGERKIYSSFLVK